MHLSLQESKLYTRSLLSCMIAHKEAGNHDIIFEFASISRCAFSANCCPFRGGIDMSEAHDGGIVRKIKSSSIPFVVLLCLFLLLGLRVLIPLLPALAWASVLSFFTYPVYKFIHIRVLRGRYSYLAAATNTCLILFLLVLPMVGAAMVVTREVGRIYLFLAELFYDAKGTSLQTLFSLPPFNRFFSTYPRLFELPVWNDFLVSATGVLANFMTGTSKELLGNVFRVAFNLFVITVASFFLTHDGHLFIRFIRDILPLSNESKDAFFMRSMRMLYAIFYGIILTAGIQGTLGALGWWFVGLDNPVLFGALMFFLAMLPFVGTPIIWVPGVVFLFVKGDASGGIILLLWGVFVVSSIDNILRPFFISGGSRSHLLLVFAGILGGLSAWGFLGLFMGPLCLSMAYFLLDLYRAIVIMPISGKIDLKNVIRANRQYDEEEYS